MKIFLLLAGSLALLLLVACSPYEKPMKELEASYRAGRISPQEYFALKSQYLAGDAQWRANFAANMQAANAQFQNSYNQQQQINAYNARTRAMTMPQTVNLNHSGYINVYNY